jgi:hypothetical protein
MFSVSLFKAASLCRTVSHVKVEPEKLLCMTSSANNISTNFFRKEGGTKKSKQSTSEKVADFTKDENILDEEISKNDYERSKHLHETFSIY